MGYRTTSYRGDFVPTSVIIPWWVPVSIVVGIVAYIVARIIIPLILVIRSKKDRTPALHINVIKNHFILKLSQLMTKI